MYQRSLATQRPVSPMCGLDLQGPPLVGAGSDSIIMPLVIMRSVVGAIFAAAGLRALVTLAATTRSFAQWHVPAPAVTVPTIAATAIVCGALLAVGALTRPVALLLATISIGMLATAGRYAGGLYLVAAPALFLACVVFAWRSGRRGRVVSTRPPGVQ
ncbi:MAG: hypothetical protein NVSMB21_01150 [Vulcanimicrobiaceae bacterium]